MAKCKFEKKGHGRKEYPYYCAAAACYSSQKCKAKDEKGNPIYCENPYGKKK